ncbi:hypothetical protein AMTRI_Chr08g163710 [Amborella trichopoda]
MKYQVVNVGLHIFFQEFPLVSFIGIARKTMGITKMGMYSGWSCDGYLEESSFEHELRRSSSARGSGIPMKMLLAEEMSKDTESKRRPPSVIARLMGLDALPTQQSISKHYKKNSEKQALDMPLMKPQKKPFCHQGYHHRQESVCPDEFMSKETHSFRNHATEQQEFKDVFEVWETSDAGKVSKQSIHTKHSEKKMELIRQKFMDAKRLSTNEKLRQSKEFHDALEVLDSNKDLFLKFLQEPDSLFTKHLHDLQSAPEPHWPSHITLLKSSKAAFANNDHEGVSEIYWRHQRQIIVEGKKHKSSRSILEKREVGYKEQWFPSSHKSVTRSRMKEKIDPCLVPTRIVVLKPSLVMEESTRGEVLSSPSSSLDPYNSICRKHMSSSQGYSDKDEFSEVCSWEGVIRNGGRGREIVRDRPKGSREIAKEITRQMRKSMTKDTLNLSSSASNKASYYRPNEKGSVVVEPKVLNTPPSENLWDWNKKRLSPNPSNSSTESTVSREAKKRLSERWKITRGGYQEEEKLRKNSSTLAEMLAVPETKTSDLELRPLTLHYMINQDDSCDKATGDVVFPECDHASVVNHRFDVQEGCDENLHRSRSLTARCRRGARKKGLNEVQQEVKNLGSGRSLRGRGSVLKDSLFSSKRKSTSVKNSRPSLTAEQNYKCEISESDNNSNMKTVSSHSKGLEDKPEASLVFIEPQIPQPFINANVMSPQHSALLISGECADPKTDLDIHQGCVTGPSLDGTFLEKDGVASSHDQSDCTSEVIILEQPQEGLPADLFQSDGLHGTDADNSIETFKETSDQPSPVSVLEPPFEEDFSSPECFERISSDLHGLRMQLHLLKLESKGRCVGESDYDAEGVASNFNDNGSEEWVGHSDNVEECEEIVYLRDLLVTCGFYGGHEMMLASWHCPDCPVDPSLFEKLEKKYGKENKRGKLDRKLLFDRMNTWLVEIMGPRLEERPWLGTRERKLATKVPEGERLVEGLWGSLRCKDTERGESLDEMLQKDFAQELGWMDLRDEFDVIGREVENILLDGLIAEALSDLCHSSW